MSNDKHSSEDEYQLPDDFMNDVDEAVGNDQQEPAQDEFDAFHDFSEESKSSAALKFFNNNKKSSIIGGLMLVGLISYFFAWDHSTNQSSQVIVQKKQYDPHAGDIKSLKALGQSTDSRLDRLEQRVSQIKAQFTAFDDHQSETRRMISTSLNAEQSLMSQVKQLVSDQSELSSQFINYKQQQAALQLKRRLAKTKKKRKPIVPVVYYLQALEPGRAWLMNPIHVGTTVAVGDRIHGYGYVTLIDVSDGLVKTSSGRIIRYAPGDH